MLEKDKKLLETTLKMYNATFKTMKERDAEPELISYVIEIRRQVEEHLKALEEGNLNPISLFNHHINYYSPYSCNRFKLDFKNSDISEYDVNSVYYEENNKKLFVTFLNSEDFFVPEYFEKNKYFKKVQLFLLNPLGVEKALIEFDGVQLEKINMGEFNYETDDILKAHVSFTFKNVTHKTL
jgi:hypothetical protein